MHRLSGRKALFPGALVGLAILVGSSVHAAQSEEHAHGHEGGQQELQLDGGKKWATDAPLRQGMSGIRDAVQAAHPAIHARKQDGPGYLKLAGEIDAQVAYMIANCKHSSGADATLHVLLVEIIGGAEQMKQADLARAREGAVRVIQALDQYPRYFDHRGWHPIH